MSKIKRTPEEVLKKYTKPGENGCIIWTGGQNDNGYGQLTFRHEHLSTHRFVWKYFKGSLPDKSKQIDHICRNRLCVNPEHLRIVSVTENHLNSKTSDEGGLNKRQCSKGHDLTDPSSYNVYAGANGRMYKYCIKCRILRRGF